MWARKPRDDPNDPRLNAWRELCNIEASSRNFRNVYGSPGYQYPSRSARLAHIYLTPPTTYQHFCSAMPDPGPPSLEQHIFPQYVHGKKKFLLDWNFDRGDHDLFPRPPPPDKGRIQQRDQIRHLRHQVHLERKAREDAAVRLKALRHHPLRRPQLPPRPATVA